MKAHNPCIALVPARDFRAGKSRLSPVLDGKARDALGRWMLDHVLAALTGSRMVDEILVLSDSAEVLQLAGEQGAIGLACNAHDLNEDLEGGRAWAGERNAAALLVVPGDLPFLRVEDIDRFIAQGRALGADGRGAVLIAPSPDGGTNGLYLQPIGAIPFRFGSGSCHRHNAAAESNNLLVGISDIPAFAHDVDYPKDLDALHAADTDIPDWLTSLTAQ